MKPKGGPEVKFELLHVEKKSSFKDRSFLPLATLDFIQTYTPPKTPGAKARITHRIEMNGLSTFLFKRVIGRKIQAGLRGAMTKLAAMAEAFV